MSFPKPSLRAALVGLMATLGTAGLLAPSASALGPNALALGLRMMQANSSDIRSVSVGPEVGWNDKLTDLRPPASPWYRLWDMKTSWRDVNPAPGVFDWTILDARVAQVEKWGGKVLLVLGLTPEWAAKDPTAGDPRWGAGSASPPHEQYWFEYLDALMRRYGTRIGAYEVWNEANLKTFWTGTPNQMARLTSMAYLGTRTFVKGDQHPLLFAPSVTTRVPSGGDFTRSFLGAMGQLAKEQEVMLDGLTIHSYPKGSAGVSFDGDCAADSSTGQTPQDCVDGRSPLLAAQQRVRDIVMWQQSVIQAVGTESPVLNLPVWDTEVNYGLAGPGFIPHVDWSDEQGASLMNYTFADSKALGIDNTFWYEFTASPFDLLGVQMTPETPATLSAFSTPTGGPSVNEPYYPTINTCTWKGHLKCPGADLKKADLSDSDLDHSDLSGANMYGVNLKESNMWHSTVSGANLLDANLEEFSAQHSNFKGATLARVMAPYCDFSESNLTGADLRQGKFLSCKFLGASLKNAQLQSAHFKGADLKGADLTGADLRGADFEGANLSNVEFSGAKLTGAKFARADFTGATNLGRATWTDEISRDQYMKAG